MYRLRDGTRFNPWPNAARGDCGPQSIIDLRRIEAGATPGTSRGERQQLADIRKLRRDVASLGRARIHPTVEDGQFTDDFLFGTVQVQERPIEELISNPLLLILNRETWLKVAEHDGGHWDGKHMEAAAVVSGLESFRLVRATKEGELVPCYGGNDLQPHFPMAIWHPCGHFEAVFKVEPQPAAKEPVAAKEPTAAKEPGVAKEPTAPGEAAALEEPVAATESAAPKKPVAGKKPAAPEGPAAPEEPTAAKEPTVPEEATAPEEPAADKEPVAVKEPAEPNESAEAKEPTAATEPGVINKPAAHDDSVATRDPAAAAEEPVIIKQPSADKKTAAVKQGGDGWVLVGKNGRPTTAGGGGGLGMDERAERSSVINKVCFM